MRDVLTGHWERRRRTNSPMKSRGSVDILATTMRIRNRKMTGIGVCYGGRRCDGRSWTPAFCPHRSASLPGGASALPQPLQQTPVHATAVAGHSVSDALGRLDLSRGRGAARRTPRIASEPWAYQRARFYDAVSLLAAPRRSDHRPCRWGNGTPVARFAAPGTEARARRGGRYRSGARGGEHVLCAPDASSRAKTAALATLAEVGGRGGFGSEILVVADREAWSLERLRKFACSYRNSFPANTHRPGAGRRRVRQREKPHLHSEETWGAKRDPRQTRKENLARTRCACRNAASVSVSSLPAPISDREHLLRGQTQALGSCARAQFAHADTPSPVARSEFQSVSPEASPPFSKLRENVNRAKLFQTHSGKPAGCDTRLSRRCTKRMIQRALDYFGDWSKEDA